MSASLRHSHVRRSIELKCGFEEKPFVITWSSPNAVKFRCIMVAFCVAVICGCARESGRDIAAISIFGKACANCLDGVTIQRGGRFEESRQHDLVAFDRRAAQEAFSSLPLDQLHHAPHLPELKAPATVVNVAVLFRDGRWEQAPVPLGQLGYDGISGLQRWTEFFAFRATAVVMNDRWRALSDAFQRYGFRSIGLEYAGCYGWCPAYAVTFASTGIATIRDRGPRCDVRAKAIVPFRRVLEAAASAGAARLQPFYPIRAVDTLGARITLVIAGRVFVSDGPDQTSWGSEFVATQSRLDQIVRDANWTPSLDLRRCAGSPGLRHNASDSTQTLQPFR